MAGFEFDDKANSAVINGVSASGQVGLGVPAAFTGIAGLKPMHVPPPMSPAVDTSISSGLGQQTSAMMADLFKPQPSAPAAASVGYKPDTNQLWSNGRVYDAGDLTALLKADAAGDLEGSKAPVPQDFNLADPSQFKAKITSTPDWKKEGMASLRNYGAGMAAIGAAMGSDAATSKFNQWNEEADLLSRASSAPKEFDDVTFGQNFLPYIRQLGIQSVPYLAEAMVTGFGLGSLFKQGGVAAAKQFAEGAIRKETTRILANSATRVTAEEALEQATKTVGSQLARGAGVVAGTYPSSVGDILSNQHEQNGQFDLASAAALGIPYAGLNMVGLEGLAGGVGRITRAGGVANGVARGVATGGATMLGEGLNEAGQEVINQFGRMTVDPRANLSDPAALARYKESFIGGALLGGMVGAPRGVHAAITPGDASPTELTQRAEQRQAGWRQDDMLANFMQGVEAAPMADYDVGPFRTPIDAFFQGLPSDMQTHAPGTMVPEGRSKKKYGPQIPVMTATGPVQMPQMEGLSGMPAAGYESLTVANQPTPLPEQGAPVAAVQPEAVPAPQTAPQMFKGKKANELWNAAVAELGEGHDALAGINQALTENKAGVAKKLLAQAIQEKQAAFPVVGATSGQQRVVDYIGQAINDGRVDDVVDAQGVLQYQKIGEALDLKRGSVKSFVNGAVKALAKQQGKTVDELRAALAKTKNTVTEAATEDRLGLAPAQQESVVNETDLFGSAEGGAQQTMGVVGSVGGSQADIAADMRDMPVLENPMATEQETKASKREMNRRFEAELEAMRMQRRKDAEAAFASGDAVEGEVLPPELRDYAGNPIKQVDIDDAAAEWEDREGSPLPEDIKVQWTKAYIANQDGVLNDRHFQEIYLELSAQAADGVSAPVNGQPVLEGPKVSRDVRVDNGTPAAEEVVRQEGGAGEEEISAQGVIDRWNKGARALGLPAYDALDAEHQDYLQGSGTWAEFDEAAAEISDEINNEGTPTFSELEAVGSSLYNDEVHLSNGVVVDQVGETEVRQYVVRGDADEQIGTATIGIRDGKPNAVYHIALFPAERAKGWGRKIVQALLDSSADGLYIQNTIPSAVKFWQSMGAKWLTNNKEHGDAVVDKTVSEGVAGDAVEGAQRQEVSRKLSESDAPTHQGSTAQEVSRTLKKLFFSPEKFDSLVTVVDTADQLTGKAKADLSQAKGKVQGFVGTDGKIYLIAENIPQGKELAVFLHEVGVHLGMEKLIGTKNFDALLAQVERWAASDSKSLEAQLARAAKARADKSSSENKREELLAYFVELAVNSGINPIAVKNQSAALTQWFRQLWAAAKAALRKIGLGRFEQLTAQHLVDLAYGAAKMELTGAWHGTAADFRNFNHDYMGSGEGAQAFGWGTYLAQRVGIAKGYWEADVNRKTGGFAVNGQYFAEGDWSGVRDALLEAGAAPTAVRIITRMVAKGYTTTKIDLEDQVWSGINEGRFSGKLKDDLVAALDMLDDFAKPEGSLMRVDTAVHDDEFLDWDKPLSEQSETVQKAMKQVLAKIAEGDKSATKNADAWGITPAEWLQRQEAKSTGEQLYNLVGNHLMDTAGVRSVDAAKRAASEYLDSIGIKGIKFLDSQSRTARKNTDLIKQLEDLKAKAEASISTYRAQMSNASEYSRPGFARLIKMQEAEIANLDRKIAEENVEPEKTRNLVIFNDKNIQRVSSQIGASRSNVKFSEAANPAFTKAQEVVDNLLADPKGWLEKLKLGFLTLEQLAWSTKSSAVQAYNKAMTDMQKVSKDIVYEASLIDQKWADLSDAESAALSSVMTRSTVEQYDPSTSATPENDEQRKIKSAYNALPASAKSLYAEVRDQYAKLLKKREAIMLNMANRAKLHGKELADIKEMFGKVKGPYFPLMRIGKFYAVGMSPRLAELEAKFKAGTLNPAEEKERARLRKDEKHYITTSHQSEREAKRAVSKYTAGGMKAYYNEQEEKLRAAAQKFPGFAQMEASITDGIEDSATRQRVSDLFTRMMFDLAPEHSALKQMMKREGIAGAHEDMRQVFAKSMLSQAHYISRLQHQQDVTAALFDVKKEGQEGNLTMRRVGNELTKRMELSLQYDDSPMLDALMNVSYFSHLGVSPAFILINSTQVPMITLPYLAARHGFRKTNTALAQAFKDTTSIIKTTLGKDGGWRSEIDWSKQFKKGSPEDIMFRELLDRNLLDITMEHDLGATARMGGGNLSAGNLAKMASTPTRITEYANRAVTALAAYRLAIADGKSHAEATDAAAKAVSMTQLNYSGLNAPRHMQSVLGSKSLARMMMQFRKYQQGMLYLLASNISDALHGESPQVRKEARNTLLGLFATTGTMAGALGLPFAGTVGAMANLIAAAFGDSDDPWDYEVALRNWLADTLGKDVGQAVAKGIPAALGADLSKRVGMGDIASPMPFVREGRTAQETAGNLALGAMGAPVGMLVGMYDGLGQMLSGDVSKGAEKVVPLKAAKDAMKAVRYSTEGMTDRRGNVIISSGQFDPWDIALRGSGFAPTKESEYYEANRAMQDRKTAVEDARSKLLNQYSRARRAGEATDDIDAKIAEFNERHPEKGARIDASSKLKAVQQGRKLDASRNEAGVVVDKRTKPYADSARFANP